MTFRGMICRSRQAISYHFFLLLMFCTIHVTVPASQTSRRLSGNWREVAIYKHFCENADGFVVTSSHVFAAVHLCFFTIFYFFYFFIFSASAWCFN